MNIHLHSLFILLTISCSALKISAQDPLLDKLKAEEDSVAAQFEQWLPLTHPFPKVALVPKTLIADYEQYSDYDYYYGRCENAKFWRSIDTTYSPPAATNFIFYRNSSYGSTFPMFQLDGDPVNIDVKIGYKNLLGCRGMSLIFNMIGKDSDIIQADTIHLPLSNKWVEQNYTLSLQRGNLLDITLDITTQDSAFAYLSLLPIEISSGGRPLAYNVDNEEYTEMLASAIQPLDSLLSSPLMDKKILALGETIHGSQTIIDLGFSMIKERIIHHNCRLVIFELPTELTLSMNRYVKNDPHYSFDFISELYEGPTLAIFTPFLQWLRDYNASHNNEVTFIGADTFLVRRQTLRFLSVFLKPLSSDYALDSLSYELLLEQDFCNQLTANQLLTAEDVESFRQCLDVYSNNKLYFEYLSRDSLMAEKVQKFCDAYLFENQTATIYGHFLHFDYFGANCFPHDSDIFLYLPSAGNCLKKRYNDDYSCLAISAAQGERSCIVDNKVTSRKLTLAPINSFEHLMDCRTDDSSIFISTNDLKQGGIFRIRASGTLDDALNFCNIEPQLFTDGIVILKQSKPLYESTQNIQ